MAYQEETEQQKKSSRYALISLGIIIAIGLIIVTLEFAGII